MRPRNSILAALLILITLVTYWPTLRGVFLWDDGIYLTDNPLMRSPDGLRRFWFSREFSDYYALSNTTLWLEWRLWGPHPRGYHTTNIALHALAVVLLWGVLKRLNVPGAWWAALLFAVHPVNAATVGMISERKNVLALVFAAASVLLYLDRRHWLALAMFLLALLSKSAVVMLPVVLLLCDWWQDRQPNWRRLAPFFGLAVGFSLLTIWFEQTRGIGGAVVHPEGFASRLAAAGWAVWFSAGKIVWPVNLTLIYPHWNVDPHRVLAWLPDAALLTVFALSWCHRQRGGRAALFGLGYFVVMLVPVLGFADIAFMRHSLVADHWQYFALIGPIALLVAAIRIGRVPLTVCAAIMCGWLSWQRGKLLRDPVAFWQDNIRKNPAAFAAHYNLGLAFADRGELSEAIAQYRTALALKSDYEFAQNNLGAALLQSGHPAEAVPHFRAALRQRPDWPEVQNNLELALNHWGNALTDQHDLAGALTAFAEAVQVYPELPEAHFNLANTLLRLGRRADAAAQYREALRLRPGWPEAEQNLKLALSAQPK